MMGFCERLRIPTNYAQLLADSAACWSVDQVALSLWLRHCTDSLFIVIVNSRFLPPLQKRSRGNQLIHRRFIQKKLDRHRAKIQRVRQAGRRPEMDKVKEVRVNLLG